MITRITADRFEKKERCVVERIDTNFVSYITYMITSMSSWSGDRPTYFKVRNIVLSCSLSCFDIQICDDQLHFLYPEKA